MLRSSLIEQRDLACRHPAHAGTCSNASNITHKQHEVTSQHHIHIHTYIYIFYIKIQNINIIILYICTQASLPTGLQDHVAMLMQATPANWPYNHDSIGKKGWAFLLPTVTPEDAKLHFPDHHSCKVNPLRGPTPKGAGVGVPQGSQMNNCKIIIITAKAQIAVSDLSRT